MAYNLLDIPMDISMISIPILPHYYSNQLDSLSIPKKYLLSEGVSDMIKMG